MSSRVRPGLTLLGPALPDEDNGRARGREAENGAQLLLTRSQQESPPLLGPCRTVLRQQVGLWLEPQTEGENSLLPVNHYQTYL